MKKEMVEIKAKDQVLGSFEFEYPESLSEALDIMSEEKIYKMFITRYKTTFMDNKRRELTGGGLPKSLVSKLKSLPADKLAKLLASLDMGVEL